MNLIANNLNNETVSIFPDLPYIINNTNTITTNEILNQIIINFNKPRLLNYIANDYYTLQKRLINHMNDIIKTTGLDNFVDVQLPILKEMKVLFQGAMFLKSIINIIILILFILSVILIYSIFTIKFETTSSEYGLLRLIGLSKLNIYQLVFIQCMIFTLPAFVFAYILHFIILNYISDMLRSYLGNNIHLDKLFYTDNSTVLFSLSIAILIPLVAIINPIRKLMDMNIISNTHLCL